MLITTDFVTNSSSSSFIISCDENEVYSIVNYIKKLEQNGNDSILYFVGSTMKELKDFTNGEVYDWASKPRGFKFHNLSVEQYRCSGKEIVKNFKTVMLVFVDYDDSNDFTLELGDYILGNWEL